MKLHKWLLLGLGIFACIQVVYAYDDDTDNRSTYTDEPYLEKVYDSYVYVTLKGGLSTTYDNKWELGGDAFLKTLTEFVTLNEPSLKNRSTFTPDIALGYKFPETPFSMELAYLHFSRTYHWDQVLSGDALLIGNYVGDTDLATHVLMLNTYWNFYTNTNFIPYVGVGVGIAYNIATNNWHKYQEDNITDEAKATRRGAIFGATFGVKYALSEHLDINASINYYHLNKAEINVQELKDSATEPFIVSDPLHIISGLVGIDLRF